MAYIPYMAGGMLAFLTGIGVWIMMSRRLTREMIRRETVEERAGRIPELQEKIAELESQREKNQQENSRLREELSAARVSLDAEQRAGKERLTAYEDAEKRLRESFQALSSEALKSNNDAFLQLAQNVMGRFSEKAAGEMDMKQKEIRELVNPLSESLKSFRDQVDRLEKERVAAQSTLGSYLNSLKDSQDQLTGETRNLVQALRKPQVRGRWGEVQLRNVVEFAGMEKHCDFVEQESIATDGSGTIRPDMIIHMPGGQQVVVDSKAPIEAYLDSVESANDAERQTHLKRHAGHVKTHIDGLSSKKYWDQFADTPEFVVLFLPGENFFSAALEQNPGLIEHALEQKILLATPTTLIALLKTIHYGWRQQSLEDNARIISKLGRELHERIQTLARHFVELKKGLDKAVGSYNNAVGSLESRILVTARRFRELGAASGEDIPVPDPVETATRALNTLTTEDED